MVSSYEVETGVFGIAVTICATFFISRSPHPKRQEAASMDVHCHAE